MSTEISISLCASLLPDPAGTCQNQIDRCLEEAVRRIEELEKENAQLRVQLEYYQSRKTSGRKKHNAKWMAIYNDFIVCYETGMTMLEIAKRNGVSERTIYRYKEEYEKMKGSGE